MQNKIYIFLTGVTTLLLIGIAGYMFGMYQGNAEYTEQQFDLTAYRKAQLHSNGTLTTLPNGWLRYTNLPQQYSLDIPPKVVGAQIGGFQGSMDEALPTAVYETGGPLDVLIHPAYSTLPVARLFGLHFKKSESRVIIPVEPGDQIYDSGGASSQKISTMPASSDKEILQAVNGIFSGIGGEPCNFTKVYKTPSKQAGTFDLTLDKRPFSRGLYASCDYYGDPNYGFEPAYIKYSPTAKRLLVIKSYQGCHWETVNHECADEKMMDSFHFTQ
jgi:hypothetical protein